MPKSEVTFAIEVEEFLDEVRQHLLDAHAHYGDNHEVLGIKGQFADIWRKVGPLKRALWEGVPLTRESPRQICVDLVGHLFLTVLLMDEEARREA